MQYCLGIDVGSVSTKTWSYLMKKRGLSKSST